MAQQISINDLPEVVQNPIIEYSKLQEISEKVKAEVESFGIDNIEATEENLSLMKKTRASLNNRFKEFEDRRKFIKSTVLKPYNDFEESYKTLISSVFSNAESSLKNNISAVESDILNEKIQGLKNYFNEVNDLDFVKFEYLDLKINRSTSDKSIQESIDSQLSNIKQDLVTINTLSNKDRVLVRYQMSRDLNASISAVNIEMEREKEIAEAKQKEIERIAQQKEQRKLREVAQQAEKEAQITEIPQATEEAQEVMQESVIEVIEEPKTYRASFKVIATMQQLQELKEFMNLKGIRYE